MKHAFKKSVSSIALLSGLMLTGWSQGSYACTDTPVLASICIMAVPSTYGNFNNQYVLAAGQSMNINQYTALYSLIGITYGGDGQTTFKLPDLRGKFVVGADGSTYKTGATGGKNGITLITAQLPPHVATLSSLPVTFSGVAVSTPLPALTGTAAVAAANVSGTVSNLKMNVVSNAGGSATPSGNYLGRVGLASANLYSTAAPDATLNAGAISSGTVTISIPASSAPVTTNATLLAGSLTGTATVSGNSAVIGSGAAIDNRPPYLALTYYIAATNGLYPSRD